MDITAKLRTVRKEHNKTQADIAEILETTQQQYSKYEKGTHEIPVRHIIKLCKYYDVSADEMLGLKKKR